VHAQGDARRVLPAKAALGDGEAALAGTRKEAQQVLSVEGSHLVVADVPAPFADEGLRHLDRVGVGRAKRGPGRWGGRQVSPSGPM
jgi:hypothetical protein